MNTAKFIMATAGATLVGGAIAFAQTNAPTIEWQKSFGGAGVDECRAVKQTADGGFILGGTSNSDVSGNKTSPALGNHDFWILKVDGSGTKLWEKSFGGAGADVLRSLQITAEGGYLLGGYSNSGASGNKSSTKHGDFDFWTVKLDENGNKIWDKSFGGNSNNILHSVLQTSDGGYILGGYSNSGVSGNKSTANFGDLDYWAVRVDADGNKLWDKTFGGVSRDVLHSIIGTSDGGFFLAGNSFSGATGNKTTSVCCGTDDSWVVKIDANGNKLFDASYGASGYESFYSIAATADGYILGGHSYSNPLGLKLSPSFGGGDFWIQKIAGDGGFYFDKSFGGTGFDVVRAVQQTSDGGAILGGYSDSPVSGNKSSVHFGSSDFWFVRIDLTGSKAWEGSFGGSGIDEMYSAQTTADGGYIIGGRSNSEINGNKTAVAFGNFDYWILKIQAPPPD